MKLTGVLAAVAAAFLVAGCSTTPKGTKFGAPTQDMTTEEYQQLVFLDPQNTVRMDWEAVQGMDGYFLIDNQGEPTVSVVDYDKGETVKLIYMGETGNHHLFIIPGARYAWSSQRYEKDVMWTIDLTTQEVVDKFSVSMDGKKVVAPLHIGFAYTKPFAVTGNILDKEHGYLTWLSTVTRRPFATTAISCPGARDAMFTLDDKFVFTTCQQEPKGVSVVEVKSRKEMIWYPIKGARAGGMDPKGKYFMVSAKGKVIFLDTRDATIVKEIEVPGGGGNFTCLPDSSKCYVGLRKANKVGVIDMKKLELVKTIDTGKDANRLYLNPADSRYGLFANESGKSDEVTIIDTKEDVALGQITTGLGPHNIAFNPEGTRAVISTKKEPVATLVDTSDPDPKNWDTITTDLEAGIQNNGVRWVPSPEALQAKLD
jgi:DNA-binding beta-propeller fold protein YncE